MARSVDGSVQRRAKYRLMFGEIRRQVSDLIGTFPSVESGVETRNFLQTDDVGICHVFDDIGDTHQIYPTVDTAATLNIPGDDAGHLIPACMNDCTNWR